MAIITFFYKCLQGRVWHLHAAHVRTPGISVLKNTSSIYSWFVADCWTVWSRFCTKGSSLDKAPLTILDSLESGSWLAMAVVSRRKLAAAHSPR